MDVVPVFSHSNTVERHIIRARETQVINGIHGAHMRLMGMAKRTIGNTAKKAADVLTVSVVQD